MPRGYAFDDHSMQRVGDAVRAVEGRPSDERDQRRGRTVATQPTLQWVQCKAAAGAGGRHPAVWVQYSEQDDRWEEMADCWLRRSPNGEVPVAGKRYLCRCHGPHPDDGYPVYVPVVSEGGGGFSGTYRRLTSGVAMPLFLSAYLVPGWGVGIDSGGYWGVTVGEITFPTPGYYHMGATLTFSASADANYLNIGYVGFAVEILGSPGLGMVIGAKQSGRVGGDPGPVAVTGQAVFWANAGWRARMSAEHADPYGPRTVLPFLASLGGRVGPARQSDWWVYRIAEGDNPSAAPAIGAGGSFGFGPGPVTL
jgi:hypothetical protein